MSVNLIDSSSGGSQNRKMSTVSHDGRKEFILVSFLLGLAVSGNGD